MVIRGWTITSIEQTIQYPARTVATRDTRRLPGGGRMNDPATAYINLDSSYIVQNDRTGEIVQISNKNDPDWQSPFA
jgi:Colicin E5 ribonuclease domain